MTVHAVSTHGQVTGQFEQHNPQIALSVHGAVTCLLPVPGDPSAMIVAGILTKVQKNTSPAFAEIQAGVPFVLLVKDNGEGRHAPPDVVTPFAALIGATAADIDPSNPVFLHFVYDFLLPVAFPPLEAPLRYGNFEVRP